MPRKLLLADDSVTIQRVIELTFADEDIRVVAVGDGDQAVERLETAPPDIVLADVGMPGRNGYEVARYIKQSPKLSHIPVVLLTGAFEPVDQAKAAEAGCDGVLAKPFEPQLVIGRVRELLTKRKGPLVADLAAPADADDEWALPNLDAATRREATPDGAPTTAPPVDIGDYFDRLDAAFADLSKGSAPAPEAPPEAQAAAVPPAQASVADEIDWFGSRGAKKAPEADLPLSYAAPESAFDVAPPPARQQEPVASVPMVEAVAPLPDSVERPAARSPVEELRPESQHDDSLHVEPARLKLPEKPALEGLESKWMPRWEESGVYRFDRTRSRADVYAIDTPPPTVSGSLHVGHVFSFTHTDLVARFHRMRGRMVFYPMGWDDNGLLTERRVQNYYGVGCDPSLPYDPSFAPS